MTEPRYVHERYVLRWFLIAAAVVCYIIALVVGLNWVTEKAKIDDVLVFLALGSALFAAGHLP